MKLSSHRISFTSALLAATLGAVAACGPKDGGRGPERSATTVGALSDATPPTVTILSPSDGSTVLDVMNVEAAITDDGPIVAAQLVVNGVVRHTLKQAPYQFTWDASGFPEDQFVVQVVAVDGAGNLGTTAPITIATKHRITQLKAASPWLRSGATLNASLALSGPAPAANWTVALTSEPAGILTHPATVQVREGEVTVPFISVKANTISVDTAVVLTASLNGTQQSVTLDVRSPSSATLFELAVPGNLQGGASTTGTVTLTNAGTAPTISLSSSDPAVQVPPSVTTGSGTTFSVTTSAVAAPVTATITATAPSGFSRTATINVLPGAVPVPTVVTFSSPTVAVGERIMATVTLSAPAPPGGALVTLRTFESMRSNLRAVVPDSLTIPAGAQSGSFPVLGTPMSSGLRGVFYANFNGVSANATDWLYFVRELPEGSATYDATIKAPACRALQTSCDTGGLIDSRANASEGQESNWPNTINASCVDGTAGGPNPGFPGHALYHYDQSVDRIRLWTTDGSPLAAGKTVNLEVKVWVFGFGNLDLLSASDANNPVWTRIAATTFSTGGSQYGRTFTTTFTLPAGPLQAIRANMGGPGPANPPNVCPSDGQFGGDYGNTIDHDDLIFAVGDGLPTDNAAPAISAGPDQTVGLPAVAILLGRVTDDGRPGALTTTWSKVSGPGTVTFGSPGSAQTGATFSIAGTYVLQMAASDGALSSTDTVTLAVNNGGAANMAPVVEAGADQIVTLPSGTTLTGAVSDDGKPNPPGVTTVGWSQLDGPATASISAPAASVTGVTFPVAGTYTFQLSANDGLLSSSDTVVVTVNPVPNTPPAVNAGTDQEIMINAAATLAGAVSDDGLPNPPGLLQSTWLQVSGPGTATFTNANVPQTTVTFSAAGTYVLRLSTTDGALVAVDDVTIVVKALPVNQAPMVDAGPDRTVTLPAAAALAGTVSDDALPAMSVVTITWSKVSGPGTVTFANAAVAATTATFSAAGTYVLRLRASDGILATTDTMTVNANPAITLKVQYRAVSPAVADNQIRTGLNIVNVGSTAVPLRELKIRYWYTVDTNRPMTVECESAAIGCSRITAAFTTVTPARAGADRYIEVGFTSTAGNLAAGAQTGEIRGRIRKNDGSNFNEANDYSYAASLGGAAPTALVDWSRITLYRNGVRVWGAEP